MARPNPYADGERLEVAGSPVRLRVSPRARRVSLRIDGLNREVIATAPSLRRLTDAAAFAAERADWMARELAKLPARQGLERLKWLRVFGEPLTVERAGLRASIV